LTRLKTPGAIRVLFRASCVAGIALMFACSDDPTSPDDSNLTFPDLENPILGGTIPCEGGRAAGFACSNVDLVAFLPLDALGGGVVLERECSDTNCTIFPWTSVDTVTVEVNDLWGWTDPVTGVEYALVGRTNGMAFISLEDPETPVYVGELPRERFAPISAWRDVKVYADHAFIVADRARHHGVQVFDLRQLRDVEEPPVTFRETAAYRGIASAHNIAINEESGFAYTVGNRSGGEMCGGGLHMIDIREPTQPTFAGCFADPSTGRAGTGYVHDAQCVMYHGPDQDYQGREICFGSNQNALSIADVTDKQSPRAVSRADYPNLGFVHQGWISEDHRFFYIDDEGDELDGTVANTRTLVWDIEDLDDPVLAAEHLGVTTSSDHNLYVRGNLMYQSNYASGLRILDISDPVSPREVGFFDSVSMTDEPSFDGSWSNYPFFQSGVIVFTSRKEGLFVVRSSVN